MASPVTVFQGFRGFDAPAISLNPLCSYFFAVKRYGHVRGRGAARGGTGGGGGGEFGTAKDGGCVSRGTGLRVVIRRRRNRFGG